MRARVNPIQKENGRACILLFPGEPQFLCKQLPFNISIVGQIVKGQQLKTGPFKLLPFLIITSTNEGGQRWWIHPFGCEHDIPKSYGLISLKRGGEVGCVCEGPISYILMNIWIRVFFFLQWYFITERWHQKWYFKKLWMCDDKTWWMSWGGDKNKPIRFWFRYRSRSGLSLGYKT